MSHYLRLRIVPPELAEQIEQRTFLGVGTGVGRGSRLIEAAFITDADAPVVPPGCMCADLVDGTATVEIAVAGDIEMIADIGSRRASIIFSTTLINTAETSARLTVVWAATRCESPFNVSSLLTCERA